VLPLIYDRLLIDFRLLDSAVRMPYTPPSQRSPAVSNSSTPPGSRRSSYQSNQSLVTSTHSKRAELPRSTSYLTRHRRTPSIKAATFTPEFEQVEPTPPGTADSEENGSNRLKTTGSLRQSPPPVTDESSIPNGAVLSPPDSLQNSSDDEETDKPRGSRELENLAELQAAIRVIGQRRESSPNRRVNEPNHSNQSLTLIMLTKSIDIEPTDNITRALSSTARKISHSRSNTESSVFIDLGREQPETSATGSEEEYNSDVEPNRSRRKPPMLRKKSGELVRPALRPSSARRRPSSMPGTPTFSKAVHFDSHLEHVRHFLQVDRPLAVSATSSPVDSYDSDAEFPFSDEESRNRGPPFEWEIVLSNFPAETPQRLRQPVRVERVFLSSDNKILIGSVAVANLAFSKTIVARFTLDYWKTTSEVVAEYNNDVRRKQQTDGYDRFNFNIKLTDQANLESKTMFFCVKYGVNGTEYWDNNNSTNFQVDFRKKAKPQKGKNGMMPASSRPANSIPRNQKNSLIAPRPKSMPVTFDDFAEGFDTKYDFTALAKQPVDEYLGESGPVRLKGVKSAVTLASDNLARLSPSSGQAFSNRYDFGASLSAAIQAGNSSDRCGITMKPKKHSPQMPAPAASIAKEVPQGIASPSTNVTSSNDTDSLRPAGMEIPVLASQSYNELLDKYCFVRTTRP
jgi:Carbohydrate/starch-binding module (family 21)